MSVKTNSDDGMQWRRRLFGIDMTVSSSSTLPRSSPNMLGTVFIAQIHEESLSHVVEVIQRWGPSKQFSGTASPLPPLYCYPLPSRGVRLFLDSAKETEVLVKARSRPSGRAAFEERRSISRREKNTSATTDVHDENTALDDSHVLINVSTNAPDEPKVRRVLKR